MLLLSRTDRQGFRGAGTGGGSLKRTSFFTEFQAGTVAEGGEGGGSGASRAGWRASHPRTVGRAVEMGSSEKAGFNRSTESVGQSWNPVGCGRIYPVAPEPDKVHDTEVPEKDRSILTKFCSQQSRWNLVSWRRRHMMRLRKGKSSDGMLDLWEKRCRRKLLASEELTRNG